MSGRLVNVAAKTSLEEIFHPASVALVGVTSDPHHWTRIFLEALLETGFPGGLYLVNPRGGKISGLKVYERIADVPDRVDYVICTAPARAAPAVVAECAARSVKAIQFCTAGFKETEEEEGIRLEAEVVRVARETGIRIIGPNCMGIYCPKSRLSFNPVFPKESGPVAMISQSGGVAMSLVKEAANRGVRFSKVISFGNACDLNESDFLEYLADDADTEVIAMYLEGTRDGQRFRRALKKAARQKVVVFFKGGVTRGGAAAVASHTGALAGTQAIWESLNRQFGVIPVSSLEELTDVLVTLTYLPVPAGKNAVLLGMGGGNSVMITDDFERGGLTVPPLSPDVVAQIRSFTPVAGNMLRNPVDYSQITDKEKLVRTLNIVSSWEGADFLVIFVRPTMAHAPVGAKIDRLMDGVYEARQTGCKPVAVVVIPSINQPESGEVALSIRSIVASGLPVYYSFTGAANAIRLVLDHERIAQKPERAKIAAGGKSG